MIREFSPASKTFIWGIPGGNIEERHGNVLDNAKRELAEEVGLCGGEWISLLDEGCSLLQDKYQQDRLHIFLCLDPHVGPMELEHDVEELIEVDRNVEIAEVKARIRTGEIQANNVAGCLLAMEKLREMGHLQ
mmetsp:Transcript_10208/g.20596  ORF Transcript_10208/g.20596 Transcript_10208/m.20596 type:complete len:133 (+) Transcript_10208:2509-2907(+)